MKQVFIGSAMMLISSVAASASDTCFDNQGHTYPCQHWAFTSSSSSVSGDGSDYQETGTAVTDGRTGDMTITGPDFTICRVHIRAERLHRVSVWSDTGCDLTFVDPKGPPK